jgi:hypothetical protein
MGTLTKGGWGTAHADTPDPARVQLTTESPHAPAMREPCRPGRQAASAHPSASLRSRRPQLTALPALSRSSALLEAVELAGTIYA